MASHPKKSRAKRRIVSTRKSLKRRQPANASQKSEAWIRRITDKAPAAIFIFQGEKNRYVNSAAEALTGYSHQELLKMNFWDILHPDYKELVKGRGFARQREARIPPRYEVKIIRKDGEERWLDYTGSIIKFRGKRAVIGTAIDITERKQAEEQIRRNLTHIQALHETNLATTSTLDLKSILEVLLEKIDRFLPCPAISTIRILNPQIGALEAKAYRNISEEEWERFVPQGGRGLSKAVVENKSPVTVLNALEDPRTRYPEFFRAYGLVSYLGVPLVVKEKVLGDISLFTKEDRRFSHEEIEFISALASQASVAIHNSQLYEQMRRKTKELIALSALTVATTQSLNLNTVLNDSIRSIIELFQFDGARIYLFNEVMDEVHLKVSVEPKPGPWSQVKVARTGEGIVGTVAKTGEPAIFEDIQADPRYGELSQTSGVKKAGAGARFFGVFPIRSKLRSWGAISCIGKEPRRLSIEEIDLMISMCHQIGMAIENTTLFEKIAEKARELSALYSVAGAAAQFLDINTLLYNIMHKVLEIFGFSAARIYILDHEKKESRLVAQEGFPEDVAPPSTYQPGEGLIGKTIESGEPLLFEDAQNDPEYRRIAQTKTLLNASYRSSFYIPLKVKGETIGVMNLVSKEVHPVSHSDVQLINSIAYHLGIAVWNAMLFSEVKQKTAALEKANKAKDEFLSVISHELRTPLNVIMGYMEIMKDGILGEISAEQDKALGKVRRQARELLTMIESILVTTRLEAGAVELKRREMNLDEFFDDLKLSYDPVLDRDIVLDWRVPADLPVISTDSDKLKHILRNLIDNAIKFTEKGAVTILARYLPTTETVEFKVTDMGIGIPREKIPAIFEMFRQLDSSETRPYGGAGLGLYIVKKFTELLGGKVEVESESGQGSAFTITLPAGP